MAVHETTLPEALQRRRENPQAADLIVTFANIGLGDFTVMVLPNGKVVVVDCGSKDARDVTDDSLRACLPKDKGAYVPIEALVMTHPDGDHFNKLHAIIDTIPIGTIHYSNDLPRYRNRQFADWWNYTASFQSFSPETVNSANTAPVEIASGGNNCGVWIIASNVGTANPNDDYGINTASVVVRAIYGNDSLIIAADATCVTEQFLINNQNTQKPQTDLASNILRVGHHGSQTSSRQTFLNAVAAPAAVISTREENVHKLPRESVVNRLKAMVTTGTISHKLTYYQDNGKECTTLVEDALPGPPSTPPDSETTLLELWVTGATGTKTYTMDGA
jgi:beta-lactamase superfamily II metal-dependent hydrolase